MTEKTQNQIVEKVEQVKTGLEQAEQEIEKAALSGIREAFLSRWLQVGLNWMLFFPVLLIERFTDYKVPRLLAFPLLACLLLCTQKLFSMTVLQNQFSRNCKLAMNR